jgi:hypothetical protein
VKNTTASALHLSIWSSKAAANPLTEDTVLTAYSGAGVPKTDAERQNCIVGVSDDCDSTIGNAFTPKACANGGAGLIKGDLDSTGSTFAGVPVPANSSITVYVAPYLSSPAGNFVLNVRVE